MVKQDRDAGSEVEPTIIDDPMILGHRMRDIVFSRDEGQRKSLAWQLKEELEKLARQVEREHMQQGSERTIFSIGGRTIRKVDLGPRQRYEVEGDLVLDITRIDRELNEVRFSTDDFDARIIRGGINLTYTFEGESRYDRVANGSILESASFSLVDFLPGQS